MRTAKAQQTLLFAICLLFMAGVQAASFEFSHTTGGSTFTYVLGNPVVNSGNEFGFKSTLNFTSWAFNDKSTLACVQSDDSYAFTDGTAGFVIQHGCLSVNCAADGMGSSNYTTGLYGGAMSNVFSERSFSALGSTW